MNRLTPEEVRQFLLVRYSAQIRGMGMDPVNVPDTFDFFLAGAIDSFGVLEMVGAIEKEFHLELDMAALDPEQMTILGPLAHYVAEHANSKRGGQDSPSSPV